jgi:hypothetical protein
MRYLFYILSVLGFLCTANTALASPTDSRCHFDEEVWVEEANGGEGSCMKPGEAFVDENGQIVQAPAAASSGQVVTIEVTEGSVGHNIKIDCGRDHTYSKAQESCIPSQVEKTSIEAEPGETDNRAIESTETTSVEHDCPEGQTYSGAYAACTPGEFKMAWADAPGAFTKAGLPGIGGMELTNLGPEYGLPSDVLREIRNLALIAAGAAAEEDIDEDSANVARTLANDGSSPALNNRPVVDQAAMVNGLLFGKGLLLRGMDCHRPS